VFSWSSVDFYGQWKALHYKAKELFRNIMISVKLESSGIPDYVHGANNIKVADEDASFTEE
jgi:beta-mannosidase